MTKVKIKTQFNKSKQSFSLPGRSSEPTWKTEALEGDITEFPSIRDKIANMEDAGKSVGQFFVPDVKSKMRAGAPPAAGWMEARTKLQGQLDSLIAKTSAKMSKYGTVHAVEPREVTKAKEASPAVESEPEPRKKQPISPALTSLIKSVANEIQKSFSSKSLANCDNDEDEEGEDEVETDVKCDENNNNVDNDEYWRNDQHSKQRQPQIDMEAPIDFDYDEPANNNCDPVVLEEEIEAESVEEDKEPEAEECLDQTEAKEELVFTPLVLDASLARSKVKLLRKTERRLPAHVLAKRKAAEKLREPQLTVMEQIKKELTDASQQVDLSNHDQDLESLNDDEKVDLIAKQMSKMESGYIMKLLKQLEAGILDISVPMLLPFLSLQVKLDLGRNIFKSLEPQSKVKVVKENFISDMINDITDIALLQEVIDRTQEKINFLCPPPVLSVMPGDYYNIEDDSYELPSYHATPRRLESPARGTTGLTEVLSHLEKLMKEGSRTEQDSSEKQKDEVPVDSSEPILSKLEEEKIEESKSSDESDEGLPGSECDTSTEEEKEDLSVEVKKEKVENIERKKETIETEKKEKIEEEDKTEKKVESEDSSPVQAKPDSKELSAATESDISPVSPPKENSETVIKHKLRNILQNCKTNEETRPVRNFGRNFEFQNVTLKPVLPNDKRPAKARRMDDMWMNSISSKQKWPCNNELSAPKPKVPWTRNKNTQPQKKEENTDVKEFKKCHKNLKDVECKQISTVKEVIQNSSKIAENTKLASGEDCKVETKEENKKVCEDKKTPKVSCEEKTEVKVTEEIIEETEKTEKRKESTQLEEKNEVEKEPKDVAEKCSVVVKEEPRVGAKSSGAAAGKETSKYQQPQIDMEAPLDFGVVDTSHLQKELLEVPNTKEKSSKKEEEEKTPVIKKLSGGEASNKDAISVPSTPTVRRRGDTFTVVIPLREKPPPPPLARPPPPPMSPPVPAERVEQLEKEEKIGKIDKKIETTTEESQDSGEESEWEWTEESEEEEEEEEGTTYEVNKEGWQNIMSTSKGPTTFKAEYSIKVGGK